MFRFINWGEGSTRIWFQIDRHSEEQEKRMKAKETCFFYTVQQQISRLSASSVLSCSVRLGLDQIRRCDQTWQGFSGIVITITPTRAAHCVIWCQIAETSDWQPRRDTERGGQKVEPRSTSLAWKAEGSQRRGLSLWRWMQNAAFSPLCRIWSKPAQYWNCGESARRGICSCPV